eukprot:UN28540
MAIQPRHRHVDTTGKVYLVSLNQWNMQRSQLTDVVLEMTTLFSQNPPVYAQPNKKPAQQNAYKPPQSQFNNIVTNVNSQQQNTLELQKKSKLLHDVTQKMKTEVKKN